MISTDSGKESFVVCRNSQGSSVRATVLRMTRHTITFEVYNPYSILQNSEVLSDFKIFIGERLVYHGKAVVSGIVNTGLLLICEVGLSSSWLDIDVYSSLHQNKSLRSEFEQFLREWEKVHTVVADFKVMIADMQIFLTELRRWLDQVEFGIHSNSILNSEQLEREVILDLQDSVLKNALPLFDKFEELTSQIEEPLRPAHRFYTRQQIHPLVLCSPFVHRAFQKPMGYAGDYETINMILNDPFIGGSLFAKIINFCFWSQPPAEAHRNRITYLNNCLIEETQRVWENEKRVNKVFNLGCGPAKEIQNFLTHDLADFTDLTLVDFNTETLTFAEKILEDIRQQQGKKTALKTVKMSVHQILKESGKTSDLLVSQKYDLVYCAGLFDYLSDRVCKRMVEIFYEMVAPGGLLIVTNVDASNPIHNILEYILEWHLNYRDAKQMGQLIPSHVQVQDTKIKRDPTGVNIFLEIRKPEIG
jgi:extracellular factor (EF) 3-hydroxypalmitic acid methyl ester biosynthesis protein